MNPEYDNIAAGDHLKFIEAARISGGACAVNRIIQENMVPILNHYIECTWGACYNTKFLDLIQPHLKDPKVLDAVLKSSVIKKRNSVTGKTGAKIYRELFFNLLRCESPEIRNYLMSEFEGVQFAEFDGG